MFCRTFQILLLFHLITSQTGCVYQGRQSIRRFWADFNTLNEPALYYEKIDHLPYHAAKVDHFRWMYNKGPNPRVPYQVVPEDFRNAYGTPSGCETPDCEPLMLEGEPQFLPGETQTQQPWMRAHPEAKPGFTPNGSTNPGYKIPPTRRIPNSREDSQPSPIPTLLPPESNNGRNFFADPRQAGRKRSFRPASNREQFRPAMISNQPVQLQTE